jgi:ribosomal protein S18 acetylase RimI-like enzyme
MSTKDKKLDLRYEIREITSTDVEGAADLIARLKRLNGEFDPLFRTSDKVDQDSLSTLKKRISDKDYIILVAVSQSKLVGVIKAAIRDRVYYEPRKEGAIVEFYIMPEFRRGKLGKQLFDSMVLALRKRGAELITAEFPSQNEIATKFYNKLGFRSLTNVYAKSQ